jgi:hypothetical protein
MRASVSSAFVLTCFAGALLALLAEVSATSIGAPNSMPSWLFLYAYYLSPLHALAVAVVATALVVGAAARSIPRPSGSSAVFPRAVFVWCAPAAALFVSVWYGAPALRMARLRHVTAPLTPAASAALTGIASGAIPKFQVRGCSELERKIDSDGIATLTAECSRGIGEWDALTFRMDGRYPQIGATVQRLGAWAYVWD